MTQRFASEGRQVGQISFLNADFTFQQLQEWRDNLWPILGTTGAVMLDASEGRNRVTIGVDAEGSIPVIRDLLPSVGVPVNAVHFEVFGRLVPDQYPDGSHLQARFRPVPGGVVIGYSGTPNRCTVGFNVYQGGAYRFIVSSHCTNTPGATDNTTFPQPPGGVSIGSEYADPAWFSGGICEPGHTCRYVEQAMGTHSSASVAEFGKIARTRAVGTDSVSGAIDTSSPRFSITGKKLTFHEGDAVDKMGQHSGWTFGYVAHTCAGVEYDATRTLLCQVTANYGSTEGDSGAPVFIWYPEGGIDIAGVHVGTAVSGRRVFSRFDQIAFDLGVNGDLTVW